MSVARLPARLSVEDYLRMEEGASERHEYVDGVIYAMTGGTADHSTVCVNLVSALHARLRGTPCRPHGSDLRLLVEDANVVTYPDAAIYCGDLRFVPGRKDVVTRPVVLFEVLSPSTRAYDRGEKFEFYRTIPTLQQYVLVHVERPLVESFERVDADAWLPSLVQGMDGQLAVRKPEISLPCAALYEGMPTQRT